MADPASQGARARGRIRPTDADQVLIAAMIQVASSVFDDDDRALALDLMARALPMAGGSSRMLALKPYAVGLLAAAPRRSKPDGAVDWGRACLALGRAVARDALDQAMKRVEA